MATKILLKKSVTGGASPLTSDLDQGELAINLVDRKIYTKDNANNITEITGAYVDSVAPTNPVEGDVWYDTGVNLLKAYNGSSFESAGYQTLGALEDVTLTSIASGDHLTWNGSAFVNSSLETDVEGFFSAVDAGGDGSLTYANGVYTYTGPSASEARAHISVTDTGGDGSLSYNSSTGVITYTGPSEAEVLTHVEGNSLDMGSNSITTTGEIKYSNVYSSEANLPSASTYHGMFAHVHGTGKGYFAHAGSWTKLLDESTSTTTDLTEGSNLYYTDVRARAAISATDAGGDGSLSYSSATGVITYTGPSAAETRAHFTGGTGVSITAGTIAIGQAVETNSDVTFNKVTTDLIEGGTTITIDPAGTGDATGEVVIAGSLTVQGTTTSVNSNEVNIGDSIILLNSDEAGTPSQNGGIEIERGTATNKSFVWNEADDKWDLANEELQNVTLDGGTY